jgi:hypothetical protein
MVPDLRFIQMAGYLLVGDLLSVFWLLSDTWSSLFKGCVITFELNAAGCRDMLCEPTHLFFVSGTFFVKYDKKYA